MLASPTENKNVLFTHDPLLILSLPRVLRVDLNFSLSSVPQLLQFDSFCGKAVVDPYFAKSNTLPSPCTFPLPLIFLTILSFYPLIFHSPLFCSHTPADSFFFCSSRALSFTCPFWAVAFTPLVSPTIHVLVRPALYASSWHLPVPDTRLQCLLTLHCLTYPAVQVNDLGGFSNHFLCFIFSSADFTWR